LQQWAANVPLGDQPQLHLLEDVTGAGKTEAALMLTHRLLANGQAGGFYVALPTMATANAMYARVAASYRRLFTDPASLVLASSQRTLVEEFAATVLPADAAEHDPRQLDDTASARCSAWLADHHKRALLAPAGVGTIDQALLAVLHSKHQSLRLLGLVHKVLVVDEVHACDAYMLAVLERLLEFHARAGGSAILLSATLPMRMKQRLLAAFAAGTLTAGKPRPQAEAYPLTSSLHAGSAAVAEQAVATRAAMRRTVRVHLAETTRAVVEAIDHALQQGRCVCWVRNTVADAVDACELFRDRLPAERLLLFHARFALHDRLGLEEQVLAGFGKTSGAAERAGRLLIATQVVEQSLDVDFDLLVSDLAPIDRLIQRAGRLARHRRAVDGTPLADPALPDRRGEPTLWVLAPPWSDTPEAGWFKAAFAKAATVYPDHGQLWLTQRALRAGAFTMPDDARALIEGVFGEHADVPAGLQSVSLAAEGKEFADQAQGQMNALALDEGYTRKGVDWWSDAKTPSRLGEATSTVALARWVDGRLLPWAEAASLSHAWAYSSLRVAARLIDAPAPLADPAQQAAVDAIRETLPAQGRWTVLLPLVERDGHWVGEALAAPRRNEPPRRLRWVYDTRCGLRLLAHNDRDPTFSDDSDS
jgi:CRISPR-associated endonuclease/helicase Cas3